MNSETALFANEAFYLAMASGDFDAMTSIWASEAAISCFHPGWEPLYGRDAVLASWRGILRNPPPVEFLGERAVASETMASVYCFEKIGDAYLVATNVYVQENGRICIIHHHASATTGRPVVEPPQKPILN